MSPIALALLFAGQTPAGKPTKTLSDMAKSVAEITKRSSLVVLPSYGGITLPEDAKAVDDIVSPLRKEDFASLVSDVAIVYQKGIPRSHWGVLKGLVTKDQKPDVAFKPVTIPQSAVKNDLITFETKGDEAIKLSSLMNLNLTRKIMVSPYYAFDGVGDFPLAMSAKDMPPGEFVKTLARGLGGKYQVDAKNYTIAFDAASFRTNFAKLIALAQKGVNEGRTPSAAMNNFNGGSYNEYQEYQEMSQPPMASSKAALTSALNLLSQAINQMNDQLLEQTFAYKGTTTKLNMATLTALQNPAIEYLKSASPSQNQQNGAEVQRGGRGPSNMSAIISRVDPRNPGRISISTDFRMSLELNLAGRRGGNGGGENTINLQVL